MNIHVIKIGGRVASEETVLKEFLAEAAALPGNDGIVVVHGGGAEVSRISGQLGHTPRFIDGVRMTTPEEMPIVDMVLAGKMNKYIVRLAYPAGLSCVGISGCDGGLFTGNSIGEGNCTGNIRNVRAELLRLLLDRGFTPVVSSVSMDEAGNPLNINADEAALGIATALKASTLVYISDIPGVLLGGEVIPFLDKPLIEQHIKAGDISGGMVPKVRTAAQAVADGVKAVVIGGYEGSGNLESLLTGNRGTTITKTAITS
ncbi:MAG: acetylglutamate kinase [Spirochaetales bacterium]|nr:acetylglutamate kinase [Spirochaetales bacterium]